MEVGGRLMVCVRFRGRTGKEKQNLGWARRCPELVRSIHGKSKTSFWKELIISIVLQLVYHVPTSCKV
jgi:hypothetical protein